MVSELEGQGSCSAGFLQLARDTTRCWHPDRFSAFTGEAKLIADAPIGVIRDMLIVRSLDGFSDVLPDAVALAKGVADAMREMNGIETSASAATSEESASDARCDGSVSAEDNTIDESDAEDDHFDDSFDEYTDEEDDHNFSFNVEETELNIFVSFIQCFELFFEVFEKRENRFDKKLEKCLCC